MTFFLLIDEQRRQNCIAEISRLDLSRVKSVEIKNYRKNRSTSQNRTYWMWLNTMSDVLGYSSDDLHEVFKQKFLGLEEYVVNVRREGKAGKAVVLREIMCRPKSTVKLSVGEFSEYLNKVEELAKEMNITLPYPDDFRYAMTGT